MEDVKEWVDALIDNMEERKNLTSFNTQIQAAGVTGDIQIYKGIDVLADLFGVALEEEIYKGMEYPYCCYFFYRNIKIFQLSRERMITGAGTG